MNLKSKIEFVYGAGDSRELAERYDQWAADYDDDVETSLGYVAPTIGAQVLARHVPGGARILDAGAGTGLVGRALAALGYRNLVGIDHSQGMLSQAREKGVYRALHRADLAQPLAFAAASFGAVISIGVFTYGHVQASCLDELIRVTEPGGLVIFSLRPDFYEQSDFRSTLRRLEAQERWELVEIGPDFACFAKDERAARLRVWAYRVLQASS